MGAGMGGYGHSHACHVIAACASWEPLTALAPAVPVHPPKWLYAPSCAYYPHTALPTRMKTTRGLHASWCRVGARGCVPRSRPGQHGQPHASGGNAGEWAEGAACAGTLGRAARRAAGLWEGGRAGRCWAHTYKATRIQVEAWLL